MSSEDMVERVARALCAENAGKWWKDRPEDNQKRIDFCWPDYVADARVAIKVMRESSNGMATIPWPDVKVETVVDNPRWLLFPLSPNHTPDPA